MLLSAVSVLVVAQSSSEIPEGLTNNPVYVAKHSPVPRITKACIDVSDTASVQKKSYTTLKIHN